MSSGHGMTPCIESGSCKKLIPPVSCKWKSRPDTRGRATPSSTRKLSQFPVLDWKHFSSRTQWATLARMEHQKFNQNLKSTQVFNSCHIYGLLFYYYYLLQTSVPYPDVFKTSTNFFVNSFCFGWARLLPLELKGSLACFHWIGENQLVLAPADSASA